MRGSGRKGGTVRIASSLRCCAIFLSSFHCFPPSLMHFKTSFSCLSPTIFSPFFIRLCLLSHLHFSPTRSYILFPPSLASQQFSSCLSPLLQFCFFFQLIYLLISLFLDAATSRHSKSQLNCRANSFCSKYLWNTLAEKSKTCVPGRTFVTVIEQKYTCCGYLENQLASPRSLAENTSKRC